jgi:cardiolipin synthase
LIAALIWACLGTVLVSGAQYVWIWSRKALEKGFRDD